MAERTLGDEGVKLTSWLHRIADAITGLYLFKYWWFRSMRIYPSSVTVDSGTSDFGNKNRQICKSNCLGTSEHGKASPMSVAIPSHWTVGTGSALISHRRVCW